MKAVVPGPRSVAPGELAQADFPVLMLRVTVLAQPRCACVAMC
jgi:hypothetical protein